MALIRRRFRQPGRLELISALIVPIIEKPQYRPPVWISSKAPRLCFRAITA